MTRDDKFLKREYQKILLPVMFSVLGGTINALIDSAFVSQRLGSDGLAAVNMCMPIFLIICTIGSLIAGGASIMSAQAIGGEDAEKSRSYYHTALTMCILVGLVVSVAGVLLAHPLAAFLSQGSSLTGYVYGYAQVIFIGVIPTALAYLPLYYLQLEGKDHSISVMMGITIGVDLVLDWLFLFVFDFGIRGAAAASVISNLVACVYGFIMMEYGYSNYHFSAKNLGLLGIKEIVRYGTPSAMGNLMDALKMFLLNMIILKIGGGKAIAVWAVLNSLNELSLCIVGGIPQAAIPMIGVYYSARENSGIRILLRLQIKIGLCLGAGYAVILVLAHGVIENLFAIQGNLVLPLLCLGSSILFEMLCGIWGGLFNVIDQLVLSNLLMFFRTFLFPVGVACFILFCGGYLWLFLPIGCILSLLVMFVITEYIVKKRKNTTHPLSPVFLLDDSLEMSGKVLDFSIKPTMENICNASGQISDFCEVNEMDARQTNRLSLAIEELLTVLVEKVPGITSVDLRAFVLDGVFGIRIRCAGQQFNPFEKALEEDDDFYMGIIMLNKMAKEIKHNYTLGMNTINISFL